MTLQHTIESFNRAVQHCDNLITVHRGHGGPGGGRRAEEVSLNRAVVVLAVASWQTVTQDLTLAALAAGAPSSQGPISPQTYAAVTGPVKQQVGAFATPNASNVRRLMQGAGFDPRPYWTWRQMGGRGVGMVTWSPSMAEERIDEWLKVRHAIAHGHPELPRVRALTVVREHGTNGVSDPTLRLVDAEQCLAFFRRLTRLTAAGLANHLGVATPPM